jgi:hypothetical protein
MEQSPLAGCYGYARKVCLKRRETKPGSRGLKSLTKMVTAKDGWRRIPFIEDELLRNQLILTHEVARRKVPDLKQRQTRTRNGGTPDLLSYDKKLALLFFEYVPTNASRKRIVQKAKAWGNAQDRLTWTLSARRNRASSMLRSEGAISSTALFSGIAGDCT